MRTSLDCTHVTITACLCRTKVPTQRPLCTCGHLRSLQNSLMKKESQPQLLVHSIAADFDGIVAFLHSQSRSMRYGRFAVDDDGRWCSETGRIVHVQDDVAEDSNIGKIDAPGHCAPHSMCTAFTKRAQYVYSVYQLTLEILARREAFLLLLLLHIYQLYLQYICTLYV